MPLRSKQSSLFSFYAVSYSGKTEMCASPLEQLGAWNFTLQIQFLGETLTTQ